MKHPLRIAIGADHGGFELKQQLAAYVAALGHAVTDCGTSGREPVDYPRFAQAVAAQVASGACELGIMVDGAGIGSAMAANKVPGALAAACYTEALAKNAREHNDANVLTLGAGHVDVETARRIVAVFLATECTEERHRRRVQMIRDLERAAAGVSAEDLGRIVARVQQMTGSRKSAPAPRTLAPADVAKLIDHTLLKPEATRGDIRKLCEEARKYSFYSVCVNPTYVRQCREELRGSDVKVCCVVGFPLGAQPTESKALEARRAIREGAREVDMVINIGALKSGDDDAVFKDIRGVVEACRDGRAVCKVILETALLNEGEKRRGCRLAMKAGADFVKTSTGFSSGGATVEDIRLMAEEVAPRRLGVKASGGVRTFADVLAMIAAGATRVGCSASVKIMEEALASYGQNVRAPASGGKG
jgi:deoxyribose-phosphate aldolase